MKRQNVIFVSTSLCLLTVLIFVSCEKTVYTGITESELIDMGKIFIDSNPKGLSIYVDKRNMGIKTPDTIKNLSAGIHSITLRNDYWSDSTFSVSISDSILQHYFIDLTASPKALASVYCWSKPLGANIYIDEKLTSYTTPVVITKLYPKKYKIKFEYATHRSDSLEILLKGGITTQCGLNLVDTSDVVDYQRSNSSIPSNSLFAVSIDSKNRKWFLSKDAGVIRLNGKTWETITLPVELTPQFLTAIFIDKLDRVWLGTVFGLYRNDGVGWTKLNNIFVANTINTMVQDKNNLIWIATTQGLVKFNGVNWEVFLQSQAIASLTLSGTGEVWGGTSRGTIFNYIPLSNSLNQITRFEMLQLDFISDQSLSPYTQAMVVDKNGFALHFFKGDKLDGTTSGIIQYQYPKYRMFNEIKVSYTNEVNSFWVDEANNIWALTNVGIYKYNRASGSQMFFPKNINVRFNDFRAVAKDLRGDLWIACMDIGAVKIKNGNY